jgi:two-component system chemotaxis response regulator CheB
MIKLLIVDDSALMRRQLSLVFEAEGDFSIMTARNGMEAIEQNQSFEPDVITLDINMPGMDGITALSHIMAQRPVPVVMVSSLTEKGALATFEALNLGAIDYVAKPGGTISLTLSQVRDDLLSKVRYAVRARLHARRTQVKPVAVIKKGSFEPSFDAKSDHTTHQNSDRIRKEGVLLIGVSTGGPTALESILPRLPENFPWPVVVAQHMPASFTAHFAARLNVCCALTVVEVTRPMPVHAGTIYIGKGAADIVFTRRAGVLTVLPKPEAKEWLWHPSVELMGRSALEHIEPRHLVAVMLTGMGYDGADAFTEIKKRGGRTIAESEETAVIFGMPAELITRGGASLVLPLEKVAIQLKAWALR